MNYTYWYILLGTISVPLLFSFHPKLKFYKKWKAFFIASVIVAMPFLVWDELFTDWGVWGFNPNYISGLYLGNLPVEEILFFIFIPFSCVFTYHSLRNLVSINPDLKWGVYTSWVLLAVSSGMVVLFNDKLYTLTTFSFLALFNLVLLLSKHKMDLNLFYISFLILLLPFFVVNGILTGTGIQQEVVWYDNTENLGIRLFTIPIEDVFYAYILIFANFWLYNLFGLRKVN